jgi:hypothetical protein
MQVAARTFLFAYANDRAIGGRYLRDLAGEERWIRRALRSVVADRLIERVPVANATIDDILDECQHHRARLAVFHFAGHADEASLMFERASGRAAASHGGSIAAFLGALRSDLKLVVLNACSTGSHAAELVRNGVPCVVTTSSLVRDRVAAYFARRFYAAVAQGATIASAFEQARTAVVVKFSPRDRSKLARSLCRNIGDRNELDVDALWQLHGEPAATEVRLIPERAEPARAPRRRRWRVAALAVLVGGAALVAGYSTWRASRTSPLAAVVEAIELRSDQTPSAVQDNTAVRAIVVRAGWLQTAATSADDASYRRMTLTGGFALIQLDPHGAACPWTLRARDGQLVIEHASADGTGCAHDVAIRAGDDPVIVEIEGLPSRIVAAHRPAVVHTRLGSAIALVPRADRIAVLRSTDNATWSGDRLIATAAPSETITLPGADAGDAISLAGDIALHELRYDRDRLAIAGVVRGRGSVGRESWSSAGIWPRPLAAWLVVACLVGLGAIVLAAPAVRSAARSRTRAGAAT